MTRLGICGHQYDEEQTVSTLCPVCEEKLFGTLPVLLGSRTEVSLAMNIRSELLREVALMMVENEDLHRNMRISQLIDKRKAKWWVEHRKYSVQEIMVALL
ncbi:hypothetical protein Ga0466249_004416 [Sporomusaceae bacterium BoRhaA]|uniref:hypothetical protein n=1 Tax=Pelorhabdus rhamnosifermentans TaxID=2772457 RepID=UPI001C064344|nr:hypothetical protein [Pelorhabdus rhamnosifermentans]MBU2703276.1 hypothetical protein [Pelorhabdus rhamnosifermentans]